LSHELENKPLTIEGRLVTIPNLQETTKSFNFKISKVNGRSMPVAVHLNWRDGKHPLHVGESWRLRVKLKRPHALMNPGCYDVEQAYCQRHLQASGTVINSPINACLAPPGYHCLVQQLREKFLNKIPTQIKASPFYGIVLALTLGMTGDISQAQWQVFRITGTNHLVAISGLHIGLVASLIAKIVGLIWTRIPLAPLYMPTLRIQLILGVLAASFYSVLAGLSPSTERALVMILAVVVSSMTARRLSTFRALTLALGVIILIDPFAPLAIGFWLSFIAVGLLVYGMNARLGQSGWWWRWGRPQWVVGLGMVPSLLSYFQQASALSLPANIVAIPWISFLVVPAALLGVVVSQFSNTCGKILLQIAVYCLQIIWIFLERVGHYKMLVWQYGFLSLSHKIGIYAAAYLTLLPQGLFYRFATWAWWLPCLFNGPPPIPVNALQLVVFDVGQGLATLIRTQHHALIYDTGNKINDNVDMGKMVVVPYLLQAGVKNIDTLVVSHGDQDHIGGASSILQAIPVGRVITSVPQRFKKGKVVPCNDEIGWSWDGVTFKFLSPPKSLRLIGNNSSCVLSITNGKQGILLTGDIEKQAEALLLKHHPNNLKATVLVAPHHGSHTSSSPAFLEAVAPKYVIFSCGYLNSYRHPHQSIVARYLAYRTQILNTVSSGAITMTLSGNSDIVRIEEYRKSHHKIWN
jgi:competence protein ComEC